MDAPGCTPEHVLDLLRSVEARFAATRTVADSHDPLADPRARRGRRDAREEEYSASATLSADEGGDGWLLRPTAPLARYRVLRPRREGGTTHIASAETAGSSTVYGRDALELGGQAHEYAGLPWDPAWPEWPTHPFA